MRAKKLLVIALAAIFGLTVLLSFAFIFSIKQVKAEYSVDNATDVTKLEKSLNTFVGKNLLFLDVEEIKTELSKYPYFEVSNIEKNYPNVINLKIKERREVYCIEQNQFIYILDQTGFVLNKISVEDFAEVGEDRILLEVQGVDNLKLTVGKKITSDQNSLFVSVFDMAKAINLTDCINKISIINQKEFERVELCTDTGVKIEIWKPEVLGVEKITKAIAFYDVADDYLKAFDTIVGYFNEKKGEVDADWSSQIEGGQNV